jgi:hypothetical protein
MPRERVYVKTDEDLEREEQLYYELPRENCEQICPAMLRMKYESKGEQNRRLHLLKRIIKRAEYKNVHKHVGHIVDFDRSESIVPHGRVSNQLYLDLWESREFNLYGKQVPKKAFTENDMRSLKEIAETLNVQFQTETRKVQDKAYVPDIFENITDTLTVPPLRTAKHNIGFADINNAPVGLANNPKVLPIRSEGNENFFSYDGQWTRGKMHGHGTYLYDDGFTTRGDFKNNWPDGEARSEYPKGDVYDGEWKRGRFSGQGKMVGSSGAVYAGGWHMGRRSGFGRIDYPCGLYYEGDWKDGNPHGVGKMGSERSKYHFHGDFEKGSIKGTGTLITPKGERINRIWATDDGAGLSLPACVRIYLQEKDDLEAAFIEDDAKLNGQLRGMQMQEYVNAVRTNLHNERTQEKKRKYIEAQQKMKEHQDKLREARIRALAGDLDSDEEDEPDPNAPPEPNMEE